MVLKTAELRHCITTYRAIRDNVHCRRNSEKNMFSIHTSHHHRMSCSGKGPLRVGEQGRYRSSLPLFHVNSGSLRLAQYSSPAFASLPRWLKRLIADTEGIRSL